MDRKAMHRTLPLVVAASLGTVAMVAAPGAGAADAAAAEALARQNRCLTCHAVDKKKVGPSFKEAAAKYKSDKDAVAKLTTHVTGGGKMKGEGGKDEPHPAVKTKKPEEVRNLVDWILSL